MDNVPIKKAILSLAIPTVITSIIQLIYNLTDTYYIGQLNHPQQLAAVSLSFPVFMVVQALGNIFAMGTPHFISRKLGAKEFDLAKRASAMSFYTAFVLGLFMVSLFYVFRDGLLGLIGTTEGTFEYTKAYLTIIVTFGPISILQISMSGFLRAEGATKFSMFSTSFGGIMNIILDPFFIFEEFNILGIHITGFGLGVKGAAIATVIGNCMAMIMSFCFFTIGKRSMLSINPKHFRLDWSIYKEILKIGVPSAISNIFMSIGNIISNKVASQYGDMVLAAQSVAHKGMQINFMMTMGFAMGYQPLAGYNYGAKNFKRLLSGMKTTLLFSTCLCSCFALFFGLFPEAFMRVFSENEEVIANGKTILRAMIISMPTIGCQMTFMTTLQATGQAIKAMIINLGRQCFFVLPLIFLLDYLWGFHGFIYAQPVAGIVTVIVAFILTVPALVKLSKAAEQQTVAQ